MPLALESEEMADVSRSLHADSRVDAIFEIIQDLIAIIQDLWTPHQIKGFRDDALRKIRDVLELDNDGYDALANGPYSYSRNIVLRLGRARIDEIESIRKLLLTEKPEASDVTRVREGSRGGDKVVRRGKRIPR